MPEYVPVTLFGGPSHGKVVIMQSGVTDRLAMASHPVSRRNCVPTFCLPDYEPPIPEPMQSVSYYIQEYVEQRHHPRRTRKIHVGIIEGCDLHVSEERELNIAIEAVRWDFPDVSILNDFEQWFSKQVYELTGRVVWRGDERGQSCDSHLYAQYNMLVAKYDDPSNPAVLAFVNKHRTSNLMHHVHLMDLIHYTGKMLKGLGDASGSSKERVQELIDAINNDGGI